ncbi:MAG: ABC transporter ATP-binding protein [Phycisphaerae bacterium]|nr:ABC transporter ATP-binding protein [Phycisphaerae bacterium]
MLIEAENVGKQYSTPEGGVQQVLRGVCLSVDTGQSVAIVGPSGSGKSTLLNCIGALDRPDEGVIRIDGQSLEGLGETELAAIRNRQIGFVFQLHHLLPQCTVLENVLIPTLAGGLPPTDVIHRAHELLQFVGLADYENHRPGQLSGGQRQRVAVVRALINNPKVLLADEPTGSLDAASADQIAKLLNEFVREDNLALIVVTHSFRLAGQMQRRYQLNDGILTELTDRL